MPAVPHDTLPVHAFPGFAHRTLASRAVGGAGVEVWSQTVEAGGATPPHHHEHEEVVVLLRGRATCRVGDETCEASAPCTLVVPAGVEHELVFSEESELLAVLGGSPAFVYGPDDARIPIAWDTPGA